MRDLSRQAGLMPKELGLSVLIVGVGGIGSNLAHVLTSTGMVDTLHLVDFDEVGEENVYPGFFVLGNVDEPKTEAVERELRYRFGQAIAVHQYRTALDAFGADIDLVIVCTDNLPSRRMVWDEYKGKDVWFMDGRMGGPTCEWYCLHAADEQKAVWYEREYEGEFEEAPCGEKSTAALTKGMIPLMAGRCLYELSNDKEPPFHQAYSLADGRLRYPQRRS